ncbi:ester cyclase [Sinomonas mesophila]|uniref:ester cyclase n=1 Tax=Sinomonas mesophila TaxID=1531955 RepID=UPI00158DDBA2|nr:ester cyclase [Sinomonas mesophila]
MTVEDVRRLDEDGVAAWDSHDPDRFVGMFADGFEFRESSLPEPLTTTDQVREYMNSWFTAFPDLHVAATDRVISDDSVAGEIEFTGTHTGPLTAGGQQIPATGKSVRSTAAYLFHVKDGKISSFSARPDTMDLMMQLGIMGSPSAGQ